VIAHELGHVVFNHLRRKQSLKGFQWFAVNEGYADYFSASYLRQPQIGSYWQHSRTVAPYLRSLTDHPEIRDPEILASGHAFSVVWSSLLWELRERLAAAQDVPAAEFDAVVLLSILHLGGGGGPYIGDAARALLKASYEKGHLNWDPVIRKVFRMRGYDISGQDLALVALPVESRSPNGFGCSGPGSTQGSAAVGASDLGQAPVDLGFIGGICLGLFRRVRRYRNQRSAAIWFSISFVLSGTSCVRKRQSQKVSDLIKMQKNEVQYNCDLGALSGSSLEGDLQPVKLALPERSGFGENQFVVVVYDGISADVTLAVQVLVSRNENRVDRVLLLDGTPIATGLQSDQVISRAEAMRSAYGALGGLLFEDIPLELSRLSLRHASEGGSAASQGKLRVEGTDLVSFSSGGRGLFEATFYPRSLVKADSGKDREGAADILAGLPLQVTKRGKVVCKQ
jgi:hypothetical protein